MVFGSTDMTPHKRPNGPLRTTHQAVPQLANTWSHETGKEIAQIQQPLGHHL